MNWLSFCSVSHREGWGEGRVGVGVTGYQIFLLIQGIVELQFVKIYFVGKSQDCPGSTQTKVFEVVVFQKIYQKLARFFPLFSSTSDREKTFKDDMPRRLPMGMAKALW